MSKITKNQAVSKLWRKGILHWKLKPVQKQMYDLYHNSEQKIVTWLCSRRIGKSYTLSIIAAETCLKKENSMVKFLCPTAKMLKQILIPIFREIFEDCPEDLRPDFIVSEFKYRFKNGSEIHLAGSDNGRAENLRGAYSNLCIVDEAGFCEDLAYTVRSVLMPTTLTTRGKIILSSTPPKNADHDFIDFIKKAEFEGTLIKKTIFENDMLTTADVTSTIDSYPGKMKDPEFRREYLAEIIMNTDTAVFPEFSADLESRIVKEWRRPAYFDYYVALDIGFVDYSAVLFGYLDFKAAKFIVEDELIINRMTTTALAEGIKTKEGALLAVDGTGEVKSPYLRVSDTNPIVINDLYKLHNLMFIPTAKDDREAAINTARIFLNSEKVIINPRCKHLISHLKNAAWNKSQSRRDLAKSPQGGHYDAAMAFVYLMRNVVWSKSPYPGGYDITDPGNYWQKQKQKEAGLAGHLQRMFKIKKTI